MFLQWLQGCQFLRLLLNREEEESKKAVRAEKAGGGAGSRFEPFSESGYERFRGHSPGEWGTQPHLL